MVCGDGSVGAVGQAVGVPYLPCAAVERGLGAAAVIAGDASSSARLAPARCGLGIEYEALFGPYVGRVVLSVEKACRQAAAARRLHAERSLAAGCIGGIDLQVNEIAAAAVVALVYHVERRWRGQTGTGVRGGDMSCSVARIVCVDENRRYGGHHEHGCDMSNRNLQIIVLFSLGGATAWRGGRMVQSHSHPDTKITNKT